MNMTAPLSPTVKQTHSNRNLLIVVVAVFVLAVAAAGGYGLWYILIGPASPAAVSAEAPVIPVNASVPAPASFDGTWQVNTSFGSMSDFSASWAGYRVQEQLVGVGGHTAVGRTPKVSGSMTLTGSIIDNVQITADLTALASDDSNRDGQLRRQAIETDTYPTAMFNDGAGGTRDRAAAASMAQLRKDQHSRPQDGNGVITAHAGTSAAEVTEL